MLFAEWERQTMRERLADAGRKLISRGGYNGGSSMPWGYRAVDRGGQLEIEPDPEMVPEVTEIVDEVLSGKAVTAVARARCVNPTTLLRRLRSPVLKGFVTYMDEVVRATTGCRCYESRSSRPLHGRVSRRSSTPTAQARVSRTMPTCGSMSSTATYAMARKAGPAQTWIRLQQGGKHWADVVREWTDEDVRALDEEPDRA